MLSSELVRLKEPIENVRHQINDEFKQLAYDWLEWEKREMKNLAVYPPTIFRDENHRRAHELDRINENLELISEYISSFGRGQDFESVFYKVYHQCKMLSSEVAGISRLRGY